MRETLRRLVSVVNITAITIQGGLQSQRTVMNNMKTVSSFPPKEAIWEIYLLVLKAK